jgi:hypothetical protein
VGGRHPRLLEAALIAVTAVWGATFVIVKEGVARVPVYPFNGARFVLAASASQRAGG